MKPLVSILIPAYNAEEWLPQTIQSAMRQTWEPKEIIIVDDGSKDQTLTIARQFESDQIKVVTQKNQGAASTRNNAFSLCKGDYIQWLDADDLIAPEKIQKQMDARTGDPMILLSGAWGRFMYRPERTKFISSPLWYDLSPEEWLIRKMENNAYMQTGSWLVSRELTEAAGPWDTRLLGDDDGEYFCRVLLASKGTRFVPDSRTYYRIAGSGSLSYIGSSDKKRDAQWLSMQLHIGYIRSLGESDRARAACVKFLQNWMTYFYPERLDTFEQAERLAESLGGKLAIPPFSWKYRWINSLFGWRVARRAQFLLPGIRWSLVRLWDKTLFKFARRRTFQWT